MGLFDSFFSSPPSAPTLASYQQPSFGDALQQYLSQQSQLPQLQGFANQINQGSNQAYQQMIFGTSPSLQGNLNQFGTNTSSLLQGQIPQDVQAQIQNSSAYQALSGGYGGSGMAHALTARDLGTTSLQLQQQGASNLSQQQQLAQALNPSNVSPNSMIYSPQTILSSDQQSDLINNQIANQNTEIGYQNQLTADKGSPFEQTLTNNLASLLGTVTNPTTLLTGGSNGAVSGNSFDGISSGNTASMGTYAVDPSTGQNVGSPTPGSGSSASGGSAVSSGAGIASMLGACCFIFLENLNGELPWYARLARDTRGTNSTVRGYRWMSMWLVPLMRISPKAKSVVNILMVKPMLKCGEDYFTPKKSALGKLMKLSVAFWFSVWTVLGITVGAGERGRDAS